MAARLLACLLATGLLCTATVSAGRMLLSDEEQTDDSPLLLPETEETPSLRSRVEAVAVDNTVILTQTSCGYLEFAVNWINSVQKLGITNWLTIVEDADSLAYINERCERWLCRTPCLLPRVLEAAELPMARPCITFSLYAQVPWACRGGQRVHK
jgi:hypothetical protein